jgi:hypothetical protein
LTFSRPSAFVYQRLLLQALLYSRRSEIYHALFAAIGCIEREFVEVLAPDEYTETQNAYGAPYATPARLAVWLIRERNKWWDRAGAHPELLCRSYFWPDESIEKSELDES